MNKNNKKEKKGVSNIYFNKNQKQIKSEKSMEIDVKNYDFTNKFGKPIHEFEREWSDFISFVLEAKTVLGKSNSLDYLEQFAQIQKQTHTNLEKLYIKMLLATLYENDSKPLSDLREKIANFSESNVDKDERSMFVSMLLMETKCEKTSLLNQINSLSLEIQQSQDEMQQPASKERATDRYANLAESMEQDQENIVSQKKKKQTTSSKTYIITSDQGPQAPKRRNITGLQKIRNEITKKKSFLLYNRNIPVSETGIKRIRIKESFENVVEFVKSELDKIQEGELILEEVGKAKVVFKKIKAKNSKKRNVKRLKVAG